MSYLPISDYGIIGDMNTAALVGMNGSIDFLCFPHFDSASVFAAILDDKKGGFCRIAPVLANSRSSQLYVPDTNMLITRFMSDEGILEITDFMPVSKDREAPSRIVRIVRAIQGNVPVEMICKPAFDYGRCAHSVDIDKDNTRAVFKCADGKTQAICLRADKPLELEGDAVIARFTLNIGETASIMINCAAHEDDGFCPERLRTLHEETLKYWRAWVAQITYQGRWRDIVNRSALTLKLLTSRRHGSIVASPTFSLPEAIGGQKNWDYRYCWIRDSAFTVYAFIRLGLKQEALAFMQWVEKLYQQSANNDGQLQLMYRIDGTSDLQEHELDHFSGYRDSRPVRIGNDASNQFQLDIYGELMDSIALADIHITKISYDSWQHVIRTADFVCNNWNKPDAGIWEFRGEQREFLHSRLMCWVALDRALKLAREESLPSEIKRWIDTRAAIYNDIFENFWDKDLQCFVQHKEAKTIDASVLLMPLVDFIGARDPRWLSTLKMVGEKLASDALVHRYRSDEIDLHQIDGSEEGSFNACSFWYIAAQARAGHYDEAWLLFSKMLSYANHLGLYAEETGNDGRQQGNFPQAFTHLALINAVFALEEMENTERTDQTI